MTTRQLIGLALIASIGVGPVFAGAFTEYNTTITLVNMDGAGEGFNDPTPVAPVAGNPGTTLGEQRLNAMNAALRFWEVLLGSDVEIIFEAEWSNLLCIPTGAILGGATSITIARNFPAAPVADVFYPIALANSIQGSDLSGLGDVLAEFNAAIDAGDPDCNGGIGWWYGIGAPPPGSQIPLADTVFHELAHGLGFASQVRLDNGDWLNGFPSIFDTFVEDHSTGKLFSDMNSAERLTAAVDTGDLHWAGPFVNAGQNVLSAGVANGHVRMYAPAMIAFGSSVSHWDEVLVPDELMEPIADPDIFSSLTERSFEEMGWVAFVARDGFETNDFSGWSIVQGGAGVTP
jgi:hypothetical protein